VSLPESVCVVILSGLPGSKNPATDFGNKDLRFEGKEKAGCSRDAIEDPNSKRMRPRKQAGVEVIEHEIANRLFDLLPNFARYLDILLTVVLGKTERRPGRVEFLK
jgi:hypothetical protein